MMNPRAGAAFAAVAVLAIGIGIVTLRHEPAPTAAAAGSVPRLKTERAKAAASDSPSPLANRSAPPASPEQRAATQQSIEEAVTTYEPAAVKTIAPFLQDPDPEIRLAARDGLIQLGEQDAIPVLRLAATRMSSDAEATACREAADYLEMPSWSDTPQAREMTARLRAKRGK